ncbi:MAG: MarR family transcriptional regulator [Lachnospiraceae bacterium]|nr:MarR family transcriptional regulator [Lachnospiraceae bacterium]
MEEKIFIAMMRASNAHHEQARIGFRKIGLSDGQPKVLYVLRSNPGMFQKDLAQRCSVTPSTMAVLLAKMESQGLIYREDFLVSPGNYAKKVFATELGEKKTDELNEFIDSLEEITMSGLSKEERENLFSLLHRVTNNLNENNNN